MKDKIPLYIIIGFLGSGKTSMLNSLLAQHQWESAGVIINDFGSLNIDASLVEGPDQMVKTELSGGQIFCSCLSGSFVDAVAAYAPLPIDALFVEASGLAKPNPLLEIMQWADTRSDQAFDFRGMVCIIDADRYFTLSQALMTVKEQVVYSDLFVINKCDLTDETTLSALEQELQLLRPGCKIIRTTYGKVPASVLQEHRFDPDVLRGTDPTEYTGWGINGRPVPMRLTPDAAVPIAQLDRFVRQLSPKTLRMKGYIMTVEHGLVLVNSVADQIVIDTDLPAGTKAHVQAALVVITEGGSDLIISLGEHWRSVTGIEVSVQTGS